MICRRERPSRRFWLLCLTLVLGILWAAGPPTDPTEAAAEVPPPHFAAGDPKRPITVSVDGRGVYFEEPPVLEDGRILVPLRAIFEALGAAVDWEEASRTITARVPDGQMRLTIGAQTAFRNGQEVMPDVPARVRNGRALVPVGLISEALGARVIWDDSARAVEIDRSGIAIDSLPFQWRFRSGLDYNFLVGRAGDTLLVLGDDGMIIGGFHDYRTLYGLDEQSGEKRWQIEVGYLGVDFFLSQDRRHLAVLTKIEPELRWLDVRTGEVLWRRAIDSDSSLHLAGAQGVVALAEKGFEQPGRLRVLADQTGDLLWSKALTAGEALVVDAFAGPVLLIADTEGINAYEPLTGEIRWRLKGTPHRFTDSPNARYYQLLKQDERNLGPPEHFRRWLALEGRLVRVDLTSGEVGAALPLTDSRHVTLVGEDYALIRKTSGPFWQDKDLKTAFYDLRWQETLWEVEGRGDFGVVEGDRLYYLLDGRPTVVDLTGGRLVWRAQHQIGADKQPVLHGDFLFVPGKERVFVFEQT